MKRRRLYLMRHAEVAYFSPDGPVDPTAVALTPAGREQAALARDALAGVELDRVVTSGLPRTIETARIVAPGHEPETWPAFEELRAGRLADIAEDGFEAAFAGAFSGTITADTKFLGGETIGTLMDRVLPALEELVADPAWDTTLAVLHGGVNRAILSYALTRERRFFGGFEQSPACVNVLDVDAEGHWIVRIVNSSEHLGVTGHARTTTMEEYYAELVSTVSRNEQTRSPKASGSSSIGA